MSHSQLTADEVNALRTSVQASIERVGDAARVADDIGALDLIEDAVAALAIFFEEFGRHHLVSSLADAVVGHTLGLEDTAVAYALPRTGIIDPPGAQRDSSGLHVDAILRAPVALPSHAVVPLDIGAVVVSLAELQITAATGFDADGAWQRVRGDLREDTITAVDAADWTRAVSLVRLCLRSELLGVATQINVIAIDHVTSRRQFGKPLGSFQTVRHRLAEAHVAIQAAKEILNLGWAAAAADDSTSEDVSVYAIAAKAMAGRAFDAASRTANQVCGGMGLTQEHPLPPFVRRGSTLNVLQGDAGDLTARIGRALCDGQSLPTPDSLVTAGEHAGSR